MAFKPTIRTDSPQEERDRLRPKIGGRVRKEPALRALLFSQLSRSGFGRSQLHPGAAMAGAAKRGGHPKRGPRAAAVRPAKLFDRRVIVKGHYYRMDAYGARAAKLHLKYLKRDGVQQDGSPGELYNALGPVSEEAVLEPRADEHHQFRFVISPEDGHELDITDFTRKLMAQMEQDLGRRLEWAAVNHYNTDHPHAHVVLRGVDLDGRELRIDQTYFKQGLRDRARGIATAELGMRTPEALEQQLDRERVQERFTSIDRDIQGLLGDSLVLNMPPYPTAPSARRRHARIVGRMTALEGMGIARSLGGANWRIEPAWDETLREMGARGDIVKKLHAQVQGDPSRYGVFPQKHAEVGTTIEGIMRGRGLHDELKGTYFASIEAVDGQSYYVPLRGPAADAMRTGQIVKVTVREDSWVYPSDRFIQDVADANKGIYTAEAHRASLPEELDVKDRETGRVSKISREQFVESALRRLMRLTAWKLVEAEPAKERWLVPKTLVATLEQRDIDMPRTRPDFRVLEKLPLEEQIRSVGPTWLDSAAAQVAGAPHGFGAAVAEARRQRHAALERRGARPDQPYLFKRLLEDERLDFGARLQLQLGIFLPDLPSGEFRGTVERIATLQSGQRVFVVQDGRRFVVQSLDRKEAPPHPVGEPVHLVTNTHQRGSDRRRGIAHDIT
jgi:type IV secretory pathway VirD2 relaxase